VFNGIVGFFAKLSPKETKNFSAPPKEIISIFSKYFEDFI